MIEKLENCPDCSKELDQAEYDGQYCRTCGTEPFGFQKAKRIRTKGCAYIAEKAMRS